MSFFKLFTAVMFRHAQQTNTALQLLLLVKYYHSGEHIIALQRLLQCSHSVSGEKDMPNKVQLKAYFPPVKNSGPAFHGCTHWMRSEKKQLSCKELWNPTTESFSTFSLGWYAQMVLELNVHPHILPLKPSWKLLIVPVTDVYHQNGSIFSTTM